MFVSDEASAGAGREGTKEEAGTRRKGKTN
jgi:hypothetical protein